MSERMEWWRDAKFGLFIHWGLYSLLGRGEWIMFWEKIPHEEYRKLAEKLNPENLNPEEWIKLAHQTGMKYAVFTTKHHDGFCLFKTEYSNFNSLNTPLGRDVVEEFVNACRKYKIRVGFYYSLTDWSKKEYIEGPEKNPSGWKEFLKYTHGQIEELIKNYGKIDILWYDGQWPYKAEGWKAKELNEMVRSYQPEIIINNRSGIPEDYDTPEQHIIPSDREWECAMPISDFWWGYTKGDKLHKPAVKIIRQLAMCAAHGGNYLLNVGPDEDGKIEKIDEEILMEVGKWLEKNGESIYGTRKAMAPSPSPVLTHFGVYTRKENKIYLHVFYWNNEFVFANADREIKRVYFLENGEEIEFIQDGEKIFFKNLPENPLNEYDTVIVLEG